MSQPNDVVVERLISSAHPAFAGHFPGAPVLPGVALLSEVMEVLVAHAMAPASALGTWDGVKFFAPVGPGALLSISLRARAPGFAFEVSQGATAVARGQWVPLSAHTLSS